MRNQKMWAGIVLGLLGAMTGVACQQSEGQAGADEKVTSSSPAAPASAPGGAGEVGKKSPVEMEIPSISLSQVVKTASQVDAGAEPLSQQAEEQRRQLFLAMKP